MIFTTIRIYKSNIDIKLGITKNSLVITDKNVKNYEIDIDNEVIDMLIEARNKFFVEPQQEKSIEESAKTNLGIQLAQEEFNRQPTIEELNEVLI